MEIPDYKPNSHKSKELSRQSNSDDIPKRKFEKVVTGTTVTKKKSSVTKLADVFLPSDMESVKTYILVDVIIPKVKTVLHDIGSEVWDSFWGISGRPRSASPGSRVSYISYDKMSRQQNDQRRYPETKQTTNYDDIVFSSRGDAELVLDLMSEACEQYGFVSVSDMYEMADVSSDNYTLNKYGWKDTSGAKIVGLSGGGYTIKMPKAYPID